MGRHLRSELDLSQLRILDALLREHSLTRAATELGITQPALSKILARLRERFDDPLFVRTAFQMKPTAKALALAPQVVSIMRDLAQLKCVLPFLPKTSDREFKYAGLDATVVVMLPRVLQKMRRSAPGVRLTPIQLELHRLPIALESGEIDLAVGSYPSLVQGIKRRRLFKTNYLSVVGKKHPRLSQLPSLEVFSEEQHIVVAAIGASHFTSDAERALSAVLPTNNIIARVPGFSASAFLAKLVDAIVTLPAPVAISMARELDLVTFKTPVQLPDIEVYQYWHERYDRELGQQWLRSTFFDCCSKVPGAM